MPHKSRTNTPSPHFHAGLYQNYRTHLLNFSVSQLTEEGVQQFLTNLGNSKCPSASLQQVLDHSDHSQLLQGILGSKLDIDGHLHLLHKIINLSLSQVMCESNVPMYHKLIVDYAIAISEKMASYVTSNGTSREFQIKAFNFQEEINHYTHNPGFRHMESNKVVEEEVDSDTRRLVTNVGASLTQITNIYTQSTQIKKFANPLRRLSVTAVAPANSPPPSPLSMTPSGSR